MAGQVEGKCHAADSIERVVPTPCIRDLIWRLLFEDKVSLAFHLARCLETQSPQCQPRLPSWLLGAVVLGRHVRHANGEIALFLKEDFAQKREVDRTDREVLGRRLGDNITGGALEQLRTHTREAVGLVRRWIELQEARLGQRKGSAQEQGEQLRQEVWSRHEAVIEELSLFKRRNPSPLTLSGLACCRRVLENMHTLFDLEASFPTEEPLPRPLLYADLLRIPSLVLNEQWEVEDSNRDALVDGIVEVVANGAPKKAVA